MWLLDLNDFSLFRHKTTQILPRCLIYSISQSRRNISRRSLMQELGEQHHTGKLLQVFGTFERMIGQTHDLRCEGCLSLLSYCSTNYKTNRTNSKHANWVIYEHAARLFAAWNCLLFSLKWLESTKPKAAKVYSSILGSEMRLWMWCVAVGHCSQLVSFNNGHNSKASQSIQRHQTVHAKPHISL